jgi:hypothetical protein
MKHDPRLILQTHHFRRILAAAAERGIDVVPLKGMDLVTFEYGDRPRRPMGDVDFLVRPERAEEMGGVMEELGFVSRGQEADAGSSRHERGYHLTTPQGVVLFELHYHVLDPVRFPMDDGALWSRTSSAQLDGQPCRRLSIGDHVAFIAQHATLHRLTNLDVALEDLAVFVGNHGNREDIREMVDAAGRWKAKRALWLLASLAKQRKHLPGLVDLERALRPNPHLADCLELLVGEDARPRTDRLNYQLQAAVVWPLLFDDLKGLLRCVMHRPS